jgi:predicted nucleotidyltransferase
VFWHDWLVHFSEDTILFGRPVRVVQDLAQKVDRAQWCSDGVLAGYLQIDLEVLQGLVDAMRDAGYLTPGGMLPPGYHGEWLEEEEASPESMRLWHLTDDGKSLAKAFIGEPFNRESAEAHLSAALARIEFAMNDPDAILTIETVHLCGSLLNPTKTEFGDVDVLVRVARSRDNPLDSAGALERQIAAEDPHLDIMVYDDLNWPYPIPAGAAVTQLLPRTPPK